jgi:DNA-binding XRE family transcriptional regulator
MLAPMPVKSPPRAGQVRVRDPQLLVALRAGRPDEKGRPGRTLTQRQAAAHIGISHGHYGDIEAGRRQPSVAVGRRMAAFFGVALAALCDEIGPGDAGEAA